MVMTLPVTRWGHGPTPVLLLHGFTGCAAAFDHLRDVLSPHVRAAAVDLPGHCGVEAAATWDAVLDALEEVVPSESAWCVAGYSQGARLALALAARGSPRIAALVLESGSPGLRRDEERAARRTDDGNLAERIVRDGLAAFLDTWDEQPLFASLRNLSPSMRAMRKIARQHHTAAGLASALAVMGTGAQPPLWDALPGIRIPTLLMTGDQDARFTALNAEMSNRMPNAHHVVIHGAGHIPHFEQPEAYAQAIIDFINGNHPPEGRRHGI